jgi:hypothetical protein
MPGTRRQPAAAAAKHQQPSAAGLSSRELNESYSRLDRIAYLAQGHPACFSEDGELIGLELLRTQDTPYTEYSQLDDAFIFAQSLLKQVRGRWTVVRQTCAQLAALLDQTPEEVEARYELLMRNYLTNYAALKRAERENGVA